mgnify:CR=1 FL=1
MMIGFGEFFFRFLNDELASLTRSVLKLGTSFIFCNEASMSFSGEESESILIFYCPLSVLWDVPVFVVICRVDGTLTASIELMLT